MLRWTLFQFRESPYGYLWIPALHSSCERFFGEGGNESSRLGPEYLFTSLVFRLVEHSAGCEDMNNHGMNIAVRLFGEGGKESVCRKSRRHPNLRNLTQLTFAVFRMNTPEFLFTTHYGLFHSNHI